ncbi:MAG TPA: ATP-binding cassette domain-containing protein [Bryobacteraceae bacterium]|jgi:phospholipid/cholesterol/gamma-HCH transport system ATP-binding protein|nr:ATP-binding cassette domain-containing protein [Bryobacteraceae bacterium]
MTEAKAEPVISVRDLVVSYNGRRVLNGINLDIMRGETMVLLGGSGSGKSTLLRHILGLEQPEAGRVLVNGVDLATSFPKIRSKVQRSIGVAFQSGALFNSMSLEDNVALPLREHTRLAESTISLMTWMKLSVVGLADYGGRSPQELSGGMKKRAAVARALSLDPEILVFDEPSAGLDPIVAAELDEVILGLKRAFSMTVVVVTHEMASAFRIADRMAMLYQGTLIAMGSKEELRSSRHPRIRQFLDGVPDQIVDPATVDRYFDRYLKGGLR